MKAKIGFIVIAILFLFATAAHAGGGGLTGGALESTQWLNKVLLGDVAGETAATAVNTANQYAKQIQQYATQLQQYAESIKANFSLPFQIYNDLKNSFTGLYSSLKGSGEGLYSYGNAQSWYTDMKSRTGWLAQYQDTEKTNLSAMKNMDSIITKEESEAYLLKQAEDQAKSAQGATSAIQANVLATEATAVATKNQTALHKDFYEWYVARATKLDALEAKDIETIKRGNERQRQNEY